MHVCVFVYVSLGGFRYSFNKYVLCPLLCQALFFSRQYGNGEEQDKVLILMALTLNRGERQHTDK